ncbi:hypothetical protein [Corticimicrobacter populi]|uniref:Uncharacterized protein n=1 Tax=Corticimicrobacter populi TaxID=2175229 RepID=A0A2V1JZ17_9BURK|nr:hypothetical protein [Corticimicrobacter populi]PWF21859.1 hypothetical protein DD235_13770 [Corticimicrobacter populi]
MPSHLRLHLAAASLALTLALPCTTALAASSNMIATAPAVQTQLATTHPSTLYMHAQKLFEQGHKDEATVWFYIGQLRFRYHLLAHPELPADGEPAVMDALNATLGQQINEWAGGSIDHWVAAIDQALDWDARHDNPLTPKDQYATQLAEIRTGLQGLRQHILDNADTIRAERVANGLDNR